VIESRVVANEARIRATVFVTRTVERNRLGSSWRRCSVAAARLPSSTMCRTRKRPTEVRAVSVAEAMAATRMQTPRSTASPTVPAFIGAPPLREGGGI
jgi:hypothetical protein